jgi:hypothetical protein
MNLSQYSLPAIWKQLVDTSGLAVQSELRRVKSVAISGPNSLALTISRRYNGSGSLFQDSARLASLEEALGRIVGQRCRIRVDWIDEPPDSTSPGKPTTATIGQQRQQHAELMRIPLVRKVTEILNAQIIKADEGFGVPSSAKPTEAEAAEPSEDEHV